MPCWTAIWISSWSPCCWSWPATPRRPHGPVPPATMTCESRHRQLQAKLWICGLSWESQASRARWPAGAVDNPWRNMADERELIAEREKKVAEIRALGGNPYANGFAPTHTAAEILARFAGVTPPPPAPGDDGRGRRPAADATTTSPSPVASSPIAAFGKAAFVKLLDRTRRDPGSGSARTRLARRRSRCGRRLERGDFIGVVGSPAVTKTRRADHRGRERAHPDQGDAAAAREVARPVGRRDALPPALRRPDREPGGARGVPQAHARIVRGDPPLPRRARLPRGRDADDALDHRRRGGASRSRRTTTRSTWISSCASRPSCTSSGWWSAASSASTRSAATSATRGCRASTTPSSRCSSSIRRTRPTRT